MSVIFNNIYKINEDFEAINIKLEQFKTFIEDEMKKNYLKRLGLISSLLIDNKELICKHANTNIKIKKYIQDLFEEEISNDSMIAEQKLILIYYKNEFYIKVLFEDIYLDKFFSLFKNTEDYYYQNKGDKPSNIISLDWEVRSDFYHSVFEDKEFYETGYIRAFKVHSFDLDIPFIDTQLIINNLPCEEKRRKNIYISKSIGIKIKESNKTIFSFLKYYEFFMEEKIKEDIDINCDLILIDKTLFDKKLSDF